MKKFQGLTNLNTQTKSKADITVSVNVTNIVKYVCIAGVAIVGIIFGCKSYIETVKAKQEEEE